MNEKVSDSEREWLQLVYEEAWDQYIHEDQMAEQRDSKYLTVFSLMFSAVGVALTIFFSNIIGYDFSAASICVVIYGMHFFILILLIVVIILSFRWQSVNSAGKAYVGLRWETAKRVEERLGTDITLAISEEKYRNMAEEKSKAGKKRFLGGFGSTESIIKTFRVTAGVLLSLDAVSLIAYTIYLIVK